MGPVESCFLYTLSCALKGIPADRTEPLCDQQWQQVFRLAGIHHVLPLVFEAVHSLPQLQQAPWMAPIRQQVRRQVFLQTRKTAEFLRLTQALDREGIRPLVVKGIVCRSLYPKPDHRYSSDEDLLIPLRDLSGCIRVFSDFGLTTEFSPEQQADSYEIPFRQAQGPLYIELHKSLFPPESGSYGHLNRFFPEAHHRAIPQEISGVTVHTLEYTDHLFYLICHALKHFLHSGFGIRQVCDILLFAKVHQSQIDWPLLEKNCRRVHALTFAAAIFRIGQRHLDIVPEQLPEALADSSVEEMPLLEDLLQAGIYGSSSQARLHSSSITLEAAASRKQNRKAANPLLLSLFPSPRKLEGRYPYLKEKPWLVPAAWASRLGDYCRDTLRQGPSASESLKLGARRSDLLRFYGILDSD